MQILLNTKLDFFLILAGTTGLTGQPATFFINKLKTKGVHNGRKIGSL
jgi:hypothetical protein